MIKRYKWILIFSLLIFIIASSYIAVMEFKSINYAIENFNRHFKEEILKSKEVEWIETTDSTLLNKQYQKALITSLLEASKSDSIVLFLDFPDSSASLMIKGVNVHSAKLENYTISSFFKSVNKVALLQMLSTPQTVKQHSSTVRKVPLMIKIAPKDTSEYTPDVVPDTSDVDLVNFILETNNGILLYFNESNPRETSDGVQQFSFNMKDRAWKAYQSYKTIFALKKPEYKPTIRIKLDKKDAKIIYRAIPENASIIIKFT